MRRAAAVLALIVVGAVAIDHHDPPATAPLAGFNNNAVTRGLASAEQSAGLVSAAGGEIDRVQVDWATLEPRPGEYEFGVYDAIYEADLAHGVRPLFDFAYAPRWAAGDACLTVTGTCHAPPDGTHVADAARTVAAIAARYPRLQGIEIWNEPNTAYFWAPRADPSAYADLLAAAYASVKRVAPDMAVAGGSLSSSPGTRTGDLAAPAFLQALLAEGGGASMDALSVHAYPKPGDATAGSAVQFLEAVSSAMDASASSDIPIWVTETGATTTGPGAVSAPVQAQTLQRLYFELGAQPDVEMVLFHTLIASPASPASPEPGYGIVDPDLTPQPGYCALSATLGGAAEC